MPFDPTDSTAVRDLSWIGDALLSLFAREWLLQHEAQLGGMRADLFRDLTSNQFLSAFGPPSVVEARIGDAYRSGGLPAAQKYFDETLAPLFLKQHANRTRTHRH
ncbi:MAG TPA: ribonuclease III domain-containing protein [Chthoniobacter sp.]